MLVDDLDIEEGLLAYDDLLKREEGGDRSIFLREEGMGEEGEQEEGEAEASAFEGRSG